MEFTAHFRSLSCIVSLIYIRYPAILWPAGRYGHSAIRRSSYRRKWMQRDLNPRPSGYEPGALPTELCILSGGAGYVGSFPATPSVHLYALQRMERAKRYPGIEPVCLVSLLLLFIQQPVELTPVFVVGVPIAWDVIDHF